MLELISEWLEIGMCTVAVADDEWKVHSESKNMPPKLGLCSIAIYRRLVAAIAVGHKFLIAIIYEHTVWLYPDNAMSAHAIHPLTVFCSSSMQAGRDGGGVGG